MKKINKIIFWFIVMVLIITIGILSYRHLIREPEIPFKVISVIRNDIHQKVFETGTARTVKEVDLSFKLSGRIEKIYLEVGQEVKVGQVLAKLDTKQLEIQLAGAKASLSLTQAGLNRLLAGVSQEEIALTQTAVTSAEIALVHAKQSLFEKTDLSKTLINNAEIALVHAKQSLFEKTDLSKTLVDNAEIALFRAEQNLEAVRIKTDISRDQVYEDALSVLETSYLNLSSAFDVVRRIQRAHFTKNDQEGIRVRGGKKRIEGSLSSIRSSLQVAKNSSQEEISLILVDVRIAFSRAVDDLGMIRKICDTSVYRFLISQTDKSALEMKRIKINKGLAGVINIQQAILLTKETNEIKITGAQTEIDFAEGQLQAVKNTNKTKIARTQMEIDFAKGQFQAVKNTNKAKITGAQTKVDSTKGHLQSVKGRLAIKVAKARQEDIDIHSAQIKQAQAKVDLLREQLTEAVLISPIQGLVGQVNQEIGEMVSGGVPLISLIVNDFQIEVDIFEEDIIGIEVGNSTEVIFIAFPDEILKGKVISINPIEKLIGGVVHYRVTIGFEEEKPGIRSGMTADVIVKTAIREDVLIIPEDALQKRDDKFIVQVFRDNLVQDRIVKIGLRGNNDMVEIILGLRDGEKVVIK